MNEEKQKVPAPIMVFFGCFVAAILVLVVFAVYDIYTENSGVHAGQVWAYAPKNPFEKNPTIYKVLVVQGDYVKYDIIWRASDDTILTRTTSSSISYFKSGSELIDVHDMHDYLED